LADVSKQRPHTVDLVRYYYEDRPFECKHCGKREVRTTDAQRHWYEECEGYIQAVAVLYHAYRKGRSIGQQFAVGPNAAPGADAQPGVEADSCRRGASALSVGIVRFGAPYRQLPLNSALGREDPAGSHEAHRTADPT
jgi:hypothetical protein